MCGGRGCVPRQRPALRGALLNQTLFSYDRIMYTDPVSWTLFLNRLRCHTTGFNDLIYVCSYPFPPYIAYDLI